MDDLETACHIASGAPTLLPIAPPGAPKKPPAQCPLGSDRPTVYRLSPFTVTNSLKCLHGAVGDLHKCQRAHDGEGRKQHHSFLSFGYVQFPRVKYAT